MTTTTTFAPVHPDLAALANELFAFTDQQLDKPTSTDRRDLMANRNKIKNFDRSGLSPTDKTDLGYLYVESTRRANRQEVFYENNDNKFANGEEF